MPVEQYLRSLKFVIFAVAACCIAVVSTAMAQANSAPVHEVSGLQVIMTIATGIMLPLLLVLFQLYRKLSEDMGPTMKGVSTLEEWRKSVDASISQIDVKDVESRHQVRNDLTADLMRAEMRTSSDVKSLAERIQFIERNIMSGKVE